MRQEEILTANSKCHKEEISMKKQNNEFNVKKASLIEELQNQPYYVFSIEEEFCDDDEVGMAVVKYKPYCFRYLSKRLRDKEDLIITALKADLINLSDVMNYISDRLMKDINFVDEILEIDPYILPYVDESFADDKNIVRKVVSREGRLLQCASERLRQDPEIIKLAVANDGVATEYVKDSFKGDLAIQHVQRVLKEHDVKNLIHFTDIENLNSILRNNGLKVRSELEERNFHFQYTDFNRLDGIRNSISLSVSFPNYEMLNIKKRNQPSRQWCIFLLKADEVLQNDCLYFAHNAATKAYRETKHIKRRVIDLESMFADKVTVKRSYYRKNLADKSCYATSPQAEILCLSDIPLSSIEACIFEDENLMKKYEFDLKRKGIRAEVNSWYFGAGPYVA